MRILNVASLSPEAVSRHRIDSMRRLGHQVEVLDCDEHIGGGSRIINWLRYRTMMGASIRALNRRLVALAKAGNFDLIWFDKPVYVRAGTVPALRRTGALVVSYNPDNPYGPRHDPGWRLFLKAAPNYDAHVIVNPAGKQSLLAAGAPHLFVMPVPYEPSVHYPPPDGWSDNQRPHDVCFVGSPYDDRADFIRELWRRHGVAVHVRGSRWENLFTEQEKQLFYGGGPIYGDAYREMIWRSRINLGFVTRSNLDTYAHRWFEITGSAGLLLAQRTDDGLSALESGEEAVFFSGVDECAEQIRRVLSDVNARERISSAGHARAVASGYDNDSRLKTVLADIGAICSK